MTGKHWAALGLFLGGIAAMVSGLHAWSEAVAPSFVGGVIAQASAAIVLLFADKPGTGPS